MKIGTCHFRNRAAAVRYYGQYEDNPEAAVRRKIAAGEIRIGPPPIKTGETCYTDQDERYIVDTGRES